MTPRQTTILIGMVLASSATGCGAVLKAAADNPAALAFLPIAAAAEVIAAAAKEDKKPSTGMINVTPTTAAAANPLAYRNWQDPDDWLAECDGPMLCSEHEQFSCTGSPDDCFCECVSAGSVAPSVHHTDPNGTLVLRAR